ncbi:MAG: TlpA family protein disulfide reductase [Epsilonproteobacteria bacterium]|nr:TlpA family protein disulfide reductase [Campylobacterota bacterium]
MRKIIISIVIVFFSINLQAKVIIKTYNFTDNNNNKIVLQAMDTGVYLPTFKGKVVLLAFFGKNCPPCLAEIPEFVKLQKKYSKNFQIVAMHVQQKMTKPELTNFVSIRNINYSIIPSSDKAFDFVNFIASKTGWAGQIPFSLLLDKNGNVSKTYLGMQREENLTKDIKALF